jgi:hypothetical protein
MCGGCSEVFYLAEEEEECNLCDQPCRVLTAYDRQEYFEKRHVGWGPEKVYKFINNPWDGRGVEGMSAAEAPVPLLPQLADGRVLQQLTPQTLLNAAASEAQKHGITFLS